MPPFELKSMNVRCSPSISEMSLNVLTWISIHWLACLGVQYQLLFASSRIKPPVVTIRLPLGSTLTAFLNDHSISSLRGMIHPLIIVLFMHTVVLNIGRINAISDYQFSALNNALITLSLVPQIFWLQRRSVCSSGGWCGFFRPLNIWRGDIQRIQRITVTQPGMQGCSL